MSGACYRDVPDGSDIDGRILNCDRMKGTWYVSEDEWYPFYQISHRMKGTPDLMQRRYWIQLTDEEKSDYDQTMKRFKYWQDRLMEGYGEVVRVTLDKG